MLPSKITPLICLIVICCWGTVDCKTKHRQALEEMMLDVDYLQGLANDNTEALGYVREEIEERIDNFTMTEFDVDDLGFDTNNEIDLTPVEDVSAEYMQISRVVSRLLRMEHKLKSLKNYFAEEQSVDTFLDSLDTQLNIGFKAVEDGVDQRTEDAKTDVGLKLNNVGSTLKSVETYVRSRNVEVAGVVYHGGIGSMCASDGSDCRLQNSSCYGGLCQCDPGLSYDALVQECVLECHSYGNTFQTTPNYILRDYNTLVLNDTTLEACKEECRLSSTFTCRSVEYFPRWESCYLSEDIFTEDTEWAWEDNQAGNHYQRDCAYF